MDEVSKKRRFLDELVETIALSLSRSDHPTYQSMRDATLEVERQTLIHQTWRRPYDGLSSGNLSQGSSKRGSFSSGTSSGRGFNGDRRGASSSGLQRGGHTEGSRFRPVSSGSSYFQGFADEVGSVRLVTYEARFMMDLANGSIHAFSAGRQDISRGTAPIEGLSILESQNQVLRSSGLVDMGDRIRRQDRPRVVPSVQDTSLHQQLEAGYREDDHLLEAGLMR